MHIVFDLDGTLVDSHAHVIATTRALIGERTGSTPSLAEIAAREAGTFEATFANHGITGAALPAAIARWGELALAHTYRPFAGIAALVETLRAQGHQLSVWTARDALSASGILAATGLASCFERVATWNPRTPKPDARGLAELVGHAAPANVAVIGDGATDLAGALAYGARPLCALWGGHADRAALAARGGTRFALAPGECLALLA